MHFDRSHEETPLEFALIAPHLFLRVLEKVEYAIASGACQQDSFEP